MQGFLDKYYPSIAKSFAVNHIKNLEELIEHRKREFKKKYNEEWK